MSCSLSLPITTTTHVHLLTSRRRTNPQPATSETKVVWQGFWGLAVNIYCIQLRVQQKYTKQQATCRPISMFQHHLNQITMNCLANSEWVYLASNAKLAIQQLNLHIPTSCLRFLCPVTVVITSSWTNKQFRRGGRGGEPELQEEEGICGIRLRHRQ